MPLAKPAIKASRVNQLFVTGDETINPIKEASFEVAERSFNIIYGPSGSGKSTLLNVLSGLQKPSNGSVHFNGSDIYELSPDELAYFRASQIGLVYQSNYWVSSLSAVDNVAMSLYFMGYSRAKAAGLAIQALERVGMSASAKKSPMLLSGGEQQRIAMARALANNPKFIIADEPTGALDSTNGDKIIKLLERCQTEFGQTVILVTHNMEYLPLADNLLHIQDGVVTQMPRGSIKQTTDRLLREMKHRIDELAETKKR